MELLEEFAFAHTLQQPRTLFRQSASNSDRKEIHFCHDEPTIYPVISVMTNYNIPLLWRSFRELLHVFVRKAHQLHDIVIIAAVLGEIVDWLHSLE